VDNLTLHRLSTANGDELVAMLARPSIEDDTVLRAYFGPDAYRRLRSLALRCQMMRRDAESVLDEKPRAHVVVVPGLLGSELSSIDGSGNEERLWLSGRSVVDGALMRLRLAEDGLRQADPSYEIRVTGVLKRTYGEIMLSLAQRYNVHAFSYDWRRSLETAADELQAFLSKTFSPDEEVHLVAHAEGGLVARLHFAKHPNHWTTYRGKLLLLGTPNSGSIAGVQALAGHLAITWWADIIDKQHSKTDFLTLVRSFPSVYELLPSPKSFPQGNELYDPQTFGPEINRSLLAEARILRDSLDSDRSNGLDPKHTVCVIGVGRPTFESVDLAALQQFSSHRGSERQFADEIREVYGAIKSNGDGRVPWRLADVRDKGISTLFVNVQHTDLLTSQDVLQSLPDLLESPDTTDLQTFETMGLCTTPEPALEVEGSVDEDVDLNEALVTEWDNLRKQLDVASRHIGAEASDDEREVEEALLENLGPGSILGNRSTAPKQPFAQLTIAIKIKLGDISNLGKWATDDPPVDAVVVGNQLGEEPRGALKALDEAISQALDQEAIIAQLIQRRVIRSELAALFLLPDQRSIGELPGRTIVIAGQGLPGRFGLPELKILSREACWMLSRLGKKHFCAVALGSGRSDFGARQVMESWVRGIKNAVTGLDTGDKPAMTVTFVEKDEQKVLEFDWAMRSIKDELFPRVLIDYTPLSDKEVECLQRQAEHRITKELKASFAEAREARKRTQSPGAVPSHTPRTQANEDPPPVRINVSLEGSIYRFGALTDNASVPERDIPINTDVILEANDDLAASRTVQEQVEQGKFLAGLLIPEDFRGYLTSDAPVILTVDATTARIHWELLCPSVGNDAKGDAWSAPGQDSDVEQLPFLGTGRGLTRQLRTSYAPKPESLPSKQRFLRVLVIADPAADAPLQGAEEEGVAVADLFEHVNQLQNPDNRVEVVRLIGPGDATQTAVLRELMNRSYDVLHFAGHCVFDKQHPENSGWVFTHGQRVTANEIRRIDRVPSFVFSNACESGITPDRSGSRSDLLAPTFAEAFFARGVANFVCTAWPVGDRSARDFALALYADLLGLRHNKNLGQRADPRSYSQVQRPQPMYVAMHNARHAIIERDSRTWGAYQHYGNPGARLFG
jgi:pimeloyl-ACP methyl ester carboxylesterase